MLPHLKILPTIDNSHEENNTKILNKTEKIRLIGNLWKINMESVKKKLGTPLIFIELIYVSIFII